MRPCRACNLVHSRLVRCEVAAHFAKKALAIVDVAAVVHEQPSSSRHGKYADPEARKAYRREWMRKRRAT